MTGAVAEAEIRAQLHVPQYFPVFDDVRLGADGAVWLKMRGQSLAAVPSSQPTDWAVISPAGSIAYRLAVPANVRVEQVSMDQMWSLQFDSDGLPLIVRYRVGGSMGRWVDGSRGRWVDGSMGPWVDGSRGRGVEGR